MLVMNRCDADAASPAAAAGGGGVRMEKKTAVRRDGSARFPK